MDPTLKVLFESLSQVLKRDPVPKPALMLTFSLAGVKAALLYDNTTLSITNVTPLPPTSPFDAALRAFDLRITIDVDGDQSTILPITDLTFDLRDYTLERLVEVLNAHQGITATILDSRFNKLLAAALIDGVAAADLTSVTFSVATNPLWIVLKPFSFAIQDEAAAADIALAQLNILTAEKYFADFWGTYTVARKSAESDQVYTQRIVNEIISARDNNKALEAILLRDLGIESEVTDLWPLVLTLNHSKLNSKLPGEVYNAMNFLVTMPLIDQEGTVEHNKAGGTRAFYHQTADTIMSDLPDFVDDLETDFFDESIFDVVLFPEQEMQVTMDIDGAGAAFIDVGLPVWTVGVTPMPGTQIA